MFSLSRRSRRLLAIVPCALVCSAVFCVWQVAAAGKESDAGQAAPFARAFAQAGGSRRGASESGSSYSHAVKEHLIRDCNVCHVERTSGSLTLNEPDIRDYPNHEACIDCHQQQFSRVRFRPSAPSFCTGCHTAGGMRNGARKPFPSSEAGSEFTDVLSHADHLKPTTLLLFRRFLGERATTTDSCRFCHQPDAREFIPKDAPTTSAGAAAASQPASPAQAALTLSGFTLPAGTFMTMPKSHATCFQCHWREGVEGRDQEPLATQCSECHQSLVRPTEEMRPTAATNLSKPSPAREHYARPVTLLTFTPAGQPFGRRRVSLKFVHDMEAHQKRLADDVKVVPINCIACHASVRRASTLELLRADENQVPLQTCATSACHTATTGAWQMRLSVFWELRERNKDAKFDCALCHAPPISLAEVPCNHYAAVYETAVRDKRSTRGIEAITPARCAVVEGAVEPRTAPPVCPTDK